MCQEKDKQTPNEKGLKEATLFIRNEMPKIKLQKDRVETKTRWGINCCALGGGGGGAFITICKL